MEWLAVLAVAHVAAQAVLVYLVKAMREVLVTTHPLFMLAVEAAVRVVLEEVLQ
jgi:hypothetical protein